MKRSLTLRTQLILLMALLVFLQSLALVLSLSISRVFSMLDSEAFRLFNTTTNARMQSFNSSVGSLVGNMAEENGQLGSELLSIAQQADIPVQELYLDDQAYTDAAIEATNSLIDLLKGNSVTGAFYLFTGSNSSKDAGNAHSAVYIRTSTPGNLSEPSSSCQMEIGPMAVSQHYQIATSINWDLDLRFQDENADAYAFYTQPLYAAGLTRGAEIERYGYWSAPVPVLKDNQPVICYTMPLIDESGQGYGVLGIEISLAHFTQYYLPNIDLPYQNSFYTIASVEDERLQLDWYIPSGPLAQVYLQNVDYLELEAVSGDEMYETKLESLGDMYISIQELTMYSKNSPFYENSWSLVGFVPKQVLHESSSSVRRILVVSIASTTVAAFAAIFLLVFASTRKISGLSKYVASLSPYQDIHFERTGMREIDELTSAVQMLNQSVINASKTTSKILELTLLPIGGFELSSDSNSVILTEFVYRLIGRETGSAVGKAEWDLFFKQITKNPADGHENIYQYENPSSGDIQWLRILQTKTETGEVGVILDVTKDIEENRRLAHELDFDALTHLYNRTAFKRETYTKIQSQPDKIGVMIFADLDNLKYINDTFGHDMGDRLIIRAGEMFREFTTYGGVASRISGDEFAVYLHGFSTKEEARRTIDLQYKQNEAYSLTTADGTSHRIRFSSGLAWYPEDSDNVTDLLKLADFAMYEAKNNRKGSVFEFDQESYTKNAYLLENREAINRLLDEGLIRFAFQPIVSLKTGEIYAYEALMRPLLDNFKSPLEILAVAAAQSKLGQLERLVMLLAFQTVSEHLQELGDTKIFINSIPSQSLSEEDHLMLERRYKKLFGNVVIEMTEAENNAPQLMKNKLAFIKKTGMKLAIDDFGSGYSNEVRVLSMEADIIKVDMALIRGIHQSKDQQMLVSNLVSFCHPKGIAIIAEGVEDLDDLKELIRLDVDFVQGYFTGRPAFEFKPVEPEAQKAIQELLNKGK